MGVFICGGCNSHFDSKEIDYVTNDNGDEFCSDECAFPEYRV